MASCAFATFSGVKSPGLYCAWIVRAIKRGAPLLSGSSWRARSECSCASAKWPSRYARAASSHSCFDCNALTLGTDCVDDCANEDRGNANRPQTKNVVRTTGFIVCSATRSKSTLLRPKNRADAYEAKRETDLAKADRQVGWTS